MTNFDDHLKEMLEQDPEFAREYKRLQPLFAAIRDVLRLRYDQGLTQAQLAERMGRQQPSIGRFEAGNTNPTLGFLHDIADALGARLVVRIEPIEASEELPLDGPLQEKKRVRAPKRRSGAAA